MQSHAQTYSCVWFIQQTVQQPVSRTLSCTSIQVCSLLCLSLQRISTPKQMAIQRRRENRGSCCFVIQGIYSNRPWQVVRAVTSIIPHIFIHIHSRLTPNWFQYRCRGGRVPVIDKLVGTMIWPGIWATNSSLVLCLMFVKSKSWSCFTPAFGLIRVNAVEQQTENSRQEQEQTWFLGACSTIKTGEENKGSQWHCLLVLCV